MLLTPAAIACGAPDDTEIGQLPLDSAQLAGQQALAEQLVVRLIEESGNGSVAVEINHSALDSLAQLHANHPSPLSDPLSAARVFAWAIGIPQDTKFELIEHAREVGEGSGLLIAHVRAYTGDVPIILRLVADPSDPRRHAVWTLNDYAPDSK